jgi:nucleotide-binding universal stress UspA family protein
MFTRLLVGLDGSPRSDSAFEQAILLGKRFQSTIILAHVRENGSERSLLDTARRRVDSAGLESQVIEQRGEPDLVLAALAKEADAALVGRSGVSSRGDTLGATVGSLIRIAERCVIVCAGPPSPMRDCAVLFDGQDASRRALELAARFASIAGSTVHIIHATDDREAGLQVVGVAEAVLSLQRVAFVTHVAEGTPGTVIPAVIKQIQCDALFAGAHLAHRDGRPSAVVISHAEEILRHTELPVVVQP